MRRFDPEALLRALVDAHVQFVVIGGVAATLHGSNLRTGDLDICPQRGKDNLARLVGVMRDLEARVRTEGAPQGLPVSLDPALLESVEILKLTTRLGDFDLAFSPSGTQGFEELWERREVFDLEGLRIPTASLEDVIQSKAAADRPKDWEALPTLRALLELRNRNSGS